MTQDPSAYPDAPESSGADREEAPVPDRVARYSGTNQLLHWLSAVLMLAIIVLGWIMASAGGKPEILPIWEWHKTLGLLVLAITAFRIVWRFIDPPPPKEPKIALWDHWLARLTYLLFFIALLAMPISGYFLSAGAGYPPILFNVIPTPPLLPKDPALLAFGKTIHLAGQWLIYALILLHLAGVVFHVAIRRDRLLERMLPEPVDEQGKEYLV